MNLKPNLIMTNESLDSLEFVDFPVLNVIYRASKNYSEFTVDKAMSLFQCPVKTLKRKDGFKEMCFSLGCLFIYASNFQMVRYSGDIKKYEGGLEVLARRMGQDKKLSWLPGIVMQQIQVEDQKRLTV